MPEAAWRFIDTDLGDAYLNMAVDESLLDSHLRGDCPPTLRVYRWDRACLSLGYFQDVTRDVDVERCRELDVEVVRRLTGGRAVLHGQDLTYCVVTSEAYDCPRALGESYRLLNRGLAAAYGLLGLDVGEEAHTGAPTSAACFLSAGRADLAFRGRKLCGSAQYRNGPGVLQHGSLPVRVDADTLFAVLKFSSEAVRERARAAFRARAVSLTEALGRSVGWIDMKQALVLGFQAALGVRLTAAALSPDELAQARALAVDKYRSLEWNLRGQH